MLGRARVKNHLENLVLKIIRQHHIEHRLGVRLEDVAEHRIDMLTRALGRFVVFFREIETADW